MVNNISLEDGFIQEISFEKDFPPFQAGKVAFGGKDQIQNLIEFYTKEKENTKDETNAKRFKINCIVGNNGSGKSRLFEKIIKECGKNNEIILDDFFVLSRSFSKDYEKNEKIHNIHKPIVNENLPGGLNYGFNGYLSSLFMFDYLQKEKEPKTKSIFSAFEKREEDFSYHFMATEKKELMPFRSRFYEKKDIKSMKMQPISNLYKRCSNSNENEIKYIKKLCKYILDSLNIKDINKFKNKIDSLNIKDINKSNNILDSLINILKNKPFKESIPVLDLLFTKVFHNIDIFTGKDNKYGFLSKSSGEKVVALRLLSIYKKILEVMEDKKSFIILIDEPDLHLHLDWQKKYIQKLIDVFSNLDTNIKLHFIIATHSPFILSDLPKESIILLKRGKEYTEIKKYEEKTFGANFVDLIRDGFFFNDKVLMGSFAEEIIGKIADKERQTILEENKNTKDNKKKKKDNKEMIKENEKIIKDIKNMIGDDFLKDNLLYFKPKNNAKD